jgi:hypothetical protein
MKKASIFYQNIKTAVLEVLIRYLTELKYYKIKFLGLGLIPSIKLVYHLKESMYYQG